jgi:hypothetical protein
MLRSRKTLIMQKMPQSSVDRFIGKLMIEGKLLDCLSIDSHHAGGKTGKESKYLQDRSLSGEIIVVCVCYSKVVLQQQNVLFSQLIPHILGPNAGLHLAYMTFSQEEHAKARLPDSAPDCLRQLSGQQSFMK